MPTLALTNALPPILTRDEADNDFRREAVPKMGTVIANQGGDHTSAQETPQPYGEWRGMLRLDVHRQATGQPWAGSPVMR